MNASYYKSENAIRALIECGADPMARNNKGAGVLQYLAKQGQLSMAKIIYDSIQDEEQRYEFVNMGNAISEYSLRVTLYNH